MNTFFSQLAHTLDREIRAALTFSIHLFGHHRFCFHLSLDWPHGLIRAALFDAGDLPISSSRSNWQVYALTVPYTTMCDLVTPYSRNRYGQLLDPGVDVTSLTNTAPIVFYDPLAQTLRAYDFERHIAYVLVTPTHVFAEWEIFSPFKEFWHYWALWNDALLMHSGVICLDNHALVLLGPGGAGKSTTTLSCVEYGMQTTGDDFNMVCMVGNTPWAYPLFTALKTKVGNKLITSFTCLKRWTSQTYGENLKIIYFPRCDDPIWQVEGAQVSTFLEPYWESQRLPGPRRASPAMQSAVSAVLQHPHLGQRYLQRAQTLLAQCGSLPMLLSTEPQQNVARVRTLVASASESLL